jgi:hypothetical protein
MIIGKARQFEAYVKQVAKREERLSAAEAGRRSSQWSKHITRLPAEREVERTARFYLEVTNL